MTSPRTSRALLLLVGLALALATFGCGTATGGAATAAPPAGWTTHADARHRLTVDLPPGWHRARESLTPDLVEPREILSVGSYPPRYDAHARCHVPGCPLAAIDDFGPEDVLVSIQERHPSASGVSRRRMVAGFPRRPRPFAPEPMDLGIPPGKRWRCVRSRLGEVSFTPFRDAGRGFYALVAIGRSASAASRRDALEALDRLSFRRAPAAGRRSR